MMIFRKVDTGKVNFLEGVENRFETREVEKFQTLNNSRERKFVND